MSPLYISTGVLTILDAYLKPTYSWRDDPLVVIWINTHTVLFQVEGKLAELSMFQFVFM